MEDLGEVEGLWVGEIEIRDISDNTTYIADLYNINRELIPNTCWEPDCDIVHLDLGLL